MRACGAVGFKSLRLLRKSQVNQLGATTGALPLKSFSTIDVRQRGRDPDCDSPPGVDRICLSTSALQIMKTLSAVIWVCSRAKAVPR
jgi:hypothetical protein